MDHHLVDSLSPEILLRAEEELERERKAWEEERAEVARLEAELREVSGEREVMEVEVRSRQRLWEVLREILWGNVEVVAVKVEKEKEEVGNKEGGY